MTHVIYKILIHVSVSLSAVRHFSVFIRRTLRCWQQAASLTPTDAPQHPTSPLLPACFCLFGCVTSPPPSSSPWRPGDKEVNDDHFVQPGLPRSGDTDPCRPTANCCQANGGFASTQGCQLVRTITQRHSSRSFLLVSLCPHSSSQCRLLAFIVPPICYSGCVTTIYELSGPAHSQRTKQIISTLCYHPPIIWIEEIHCAFGTNSQIVNLKIINNLVKQIMTSEFYCFLLFCIFYLFINIIN